MCSLMRQCQRVSQRTWHPQIKTCRTHVRWAFTRGLAADLAAHTTPDILIYVLAWWSLMHRQA